MRLEDYAVVNCPLCGKTVVLPRIFAPAGYGTMKYIAVVHGNHAVVAGFDKFGVVRTVKAYRCIPGYTGEVEIRCPTCGRPIKVGHVSEPVCVNHEDHIVVLFPFGRSFEAAVYDVVKPIRQALKPSIVKKLVREMGYEGLAYALYSVYLKKSKTLMAPAVVMDDLKKLMRDVFGASVSVVAGMPLNIRAPEIQYFVKAIKAVENLSYPEAVHTLRDMVEVLDGLKESLEKILKMHGVRAFCAELKKVAVGDRQAYEILRKMFRIKCD